MRSSSSSARRGTIVITGGAGFVGSSLAHALAEQGWHVALLDNLSRPGVERNVAWLQALHGDCIELAALDIRDGPGVRRWIARVADGSRGGIAGIFHFAAQVAVTSSLTDPMFDFQVNALGTLHLLEALRTLRLRPPFVFTSTNKVYGCLTDLPTRRVADRYQPEDLQLAAHGIDERRPLDFQSPYGCSKGTADQYVLEYARTYGLPATVFRMSCIYGPHQYGTEDQGWIAHFLLRALAGRPITIYGDGYQVRDALYVDDLVRAFQLALVALAREASASTRAGESVRLSTALSGEAFNIGGGPDRAISLVELLRHIRRLRGGSLKVERGAWRLGDQRYYVSDTRKFRLATGWQPRVSVNEGITRLLQWLNEQRGLERADACKSASIVDEDPIGAGQHIQPVAEVAGASTGRIVP